MRIKPTKNKNYRTLINKSKIFRLFSYWTPILYKQTRNLFFLIRVKINPFISFRFIYLSNKKLFDLRKFRFKKVQIDFVILGAQKSGTSSLHKYLDTHSEVFMSFPMKESRYFMGNDFVRDFYKKRFNIKVSDNDSLFKNFIIQGYNNEVLIGESSTAYTLGRRSVDYDVPKRMFEENPNLKFIYILRNPYSRIVSNYFHLKEKHLKRSNFNDILNSENHIIETSLYYRQLSEYLKFFPKDRFKIVFFEEFIQDKEKILNDIFMFLGVSKEQVKYEEIFNKSKREVNSSRETLFSKDNFQIISPKINSDVKKLEDFIGEGINCWNLDESEWVTKIN